MEGNKKEFKILKGMTLTKIEVGVYDDVIIFYTSNGRKFKLYHSQEHWEQVSIDDICGDLNDLIGHPITLTEEVTNKDENPKNIPIPECQDSYTWTFYKLATDKGFITIRWYGESNGHYSESVDFVEIIN